jgi:hypothetical protein
VSEWIKASASSGSGGECVEMRRNGDAVQVRDSKDLGEGPILSLTPAAFQELLAAAKAGELDGLA